MSIRNSTAALVAGLTATLLGCSGDGVTTSGVGRASAALGNAGALGYVAIDLGALEEFSEGHAINDAGQVMGATYGSGGPDLAGFLWQDGVATSIGSLGGGYSWPEGLNASGWISGESWTADRKMRAVLFDGAVLHDLGTLGGDFSSATRIGDAGHVIGRSNLVAGTSPSRAFVWYAGTMTDLGTLGGTYSVATAVNSVGQVVGVSGTADGQRHGFLWQDGQMTDLGDFVPYFIDEAGRMASRDAVWRDGVVTSVGDLGGAGTTIRAMNQVGQLCGTSLTAAGQRHGFVWTDGVMVDIDAAGGTLSDPLAINDAGQVVGRITILAAGLQQSFLWTGGQLWNLGTLAGTWSEATDINSAGVIIGTSDEPSGGYHATMWRVLTPEETVQDLLGDVADLETAGTLSAGETASLTSTLQIVTALLNDDRTEPAARQLDAYINKVQALVTSGRLSEPDAEALIAPARQVLASIRG